VSFWKKGIWLQKILRIFHPFAGNPPLEGFTWDFAWVVISPSNQLCQILSQSDQGFWFCGGSNFWLSHKKEKSPLTQGLNYRSACDAANKWRLTMRRKMLSIFLFMKFSYCGGVFLEPLNTNSVPYTIPYVGILITSLNEAIPCWFLL